jgi:alcohol dehydrogenase class IV
MIFEWLPKSVGNLADLEAREKMLVAANLAGMSFGNSQACLAHSLGHSLGSVLRIQHGMAVGMALPYTIEFIARDNPEPAKHYWELSQLIGVDNDDHEGAAMEFAERIRGLQKDTDFPLNLKDAGVSKKDFDSGLEQLVEYAMMDTSLTMTPKSIQSADIRKLYKYMFEGKTVDF